MGVVRAQADVRLLDLNGRAVAGWRAARAAAPKNREGAAPPELRRQLIEQRIRL